LTKLNALHIIHMKTGHTRRKCR